MIQYSQDSLLGSLPRLCALCLPGSFPALEGVVVEQGEDSAVIGQQTSSYVDHPLALLVGLYEDMETCEKITEGARNRGGRPGYGD